MSPIEFIVWQATTNCNFNCPNCCARSGRKGFTEETPSPSYIRDRIAPFVSLDSTWVHFTGGEPFLAYRFPELAEEVSKVVKYVSINTNFSLRTGIEDFESRVPPKKVLTYTSSFHPLVLSHVDRLDFYKRVEASMKKGYRFHILIVVHPLLKDTELASYVSDFESIGLDMSNSCKVFFGQYDSKNYPFEMHDHYRYKYDRFVRESDKIFERGMPVWTGIPCSAGSRSIWMTPMGNVYRCVREHRGFGLGNLFDGTFVPLKKSEPCKSNNCACVNVCAKYAEGGIGAVKFID